MRCSRRGAIGGALALAVAPGAAFGAGVDPFALDLVRLRDGRFVRHHMGGDTDLVALYFGAGWCGPCRAFVPALAAAYPRLRAARIEIVFVSDDAGCRAQRDYVLRSRMPWPVVDCGDPARRRLRALGGAALPGLIAIDRAGATVVDSWRGGRSYPAEGLERLLQITG